MARFDLVAYLSPKLGKARLKSNELVGQCPLHDDSSPSFSINVDTGRWLCRSVSCGERGSSVVSLISKIEKIPYRDAAKIAQVRMPLYSHDDFEELVAGMATPKRAPVFSKLPDCISAVSPDFYPEYLVSRRYPKETFVAPAFDMKIGTRSRDEYGGRFGGYLILPVYDKDKNYLSFTARYTGRDPHKPRYDGPSDSIKNYLYGEWLLNDEPNEPVYIVEGQFDVFRLWTFGENVLGTFGTSYTHAQVRRLCGLLGKRKAIVCFDADATSHENDDLGLEETHSKPLELVSTLVSLGVPCSTLVMPPGVKDPDSFKDLNEWHAASRLLT